MTEVDEYNLAEEIGAMYERNTKLEAECERLRAALRDVQRMYVLNVHNHRLVRDCVDAALAGAPAPASIERDGARNALACIDKHLATAREVLRVALEGER